MKLIDKVGRPLARSEIEIDKGHVWDLLGEQAAGLGCGRDWSRHIGSTGPKKAFHCHAELPRILDQENAHAFKAR
jgi:hypothetical protein